MAIDKKWKTLIRETCLKKIFDDYKLHPHLARYKRLTPSKRCFIDGTFRTPDIVLVFDDFGERLKNDEAINFLVTVSRKMRITIIFIAQCSRVLSSTSRDNIAAVVPTTLASYHWVSR